MAHTTEIPPSEFCKRLYYDTAVFDTTLLSHLVSDMGADRVLLGTDHPFELGDTDPVATVRALDLGVDDTEAILWRTADSLLGYPPQRKPPPVPPSMGGDGWTVCFSPRLQFALTTLYHFFFVPVSISSLFYLAIMQTAWYRTGKPKYLKMVGSSGASRS